MPNPMQKNMMPEVDPTDPWKDDVLERQSAAEYLTPVLASIRQPFVIALQSQFGTGKSFFVQRWRQDLENQGYRAMVFNAWETDYSNDPLAAFMAAVDEQIGQWLIAGQLRSFRSKFKKLTKESAAIARAGLPILAKGVVRKALGEETIEEVIDLIGADEKDVVDAVGKAVANKVAAQKNAKEAVNKFRNELSGIVDLISKDRKSDDHKKLIVFIDELDRCRPDYALDLLESIKHLFSVEGLVLVLAVDSVQLQNLVTARYGSVDEDAYLRKFIDWRFSFPRPPRHGFAKHLIQQFDLPSLAIFTKQGDQFDLNAFVAGFGLFSSLFGFSLRDQEQCATMANLYFRSLTTQNVPFCEVVGALIPIRTRFRIPVDDAIRSLAGSDKLVTLLDEQAHLLPDRIPYKDWTRYRSIIQSWFLTDSLRDDWASQNKSGLDALANEEGGASIAMDANERMRAWHVKSAIQHYNNISFNYSLYRISMAQVVIERLNGVGEFL